MYIENLIYKQQKGGKKVQALRIWTWPIWSAHHVSSWEICIEGPIVCNSRLQSQHIFIISNNIGSLDRYELAVAGGPAIDLPQHCTQSLARPTLVHHRRLVIRVHLGQEQTNYCSQIETTLKILFTAVSQRTGRTNCFVKFFWTVSPFVTISPVTLV